MLCTSEVYAFSGLWLSLNFHTVFFFFLSSTGGGLSSLGLCSGRKSTAVITVMI